MGKAKHPHDSSRPVSASIRRALEDSDIEEVIRHLTVRQKRFAEEYVIDFNGTAAAIRAGYATKYADRQAHILLRHEGIAAYVDHLSISKEAKIVSIDPDYVIQEIVSVVRKENVKDNDKLRALELLARHLGMFVDKTEITGKDGGPLEIDQRVKEDANTFINNLKALDRPKLKVVGDED